MKKEDVVAHVLGRSRENRPQREVAVAFAPTNIALCKYWGKRDAELNLPVTSSLSISLGQKGATCTLRATDLAQDSYSLNGKTMPLSSPFAQRLNAYLNLFRGSLGCHFQVEMQMNIPYAAGLASSACGFASLLLALNDFFGWNLESRELSILARLGSGSACRSITPGFVEWRAGSSMDGMDSYGESLATHWPELCVGLLVLNEGEKPLASRVAMERTAATSPLYSAWPAKVERDLAMLKRAIEKKDFQLLGETAESNALTMHALMLSAWPPISYALPQTLLAMQMVWRLRQEGVAVYLTQDAGPNLKLLFLARERKRLGQHFADLEVLQPQI